MIPPDRHNQIVHPEVPVRRDVMDFLLDKPVVSVNRGNYSWEKPFCNPNKKVHEAVMRLLHVRDPDDWPVPVDPDKFFFVAPAPYLPRLRMDTCTAVCGT